MMVFSFSSLTRILVLLIGGFIWQDRDPKVSCSVHRVNELDGSVIECDAFSSESRSAMPVFCDARVRHDWSVALVGASISVPRVRDT